MLFSWLKNRRRRKLLAEPFPDPWLEFLEHNVHHYSHLTAQQQARLRDDLRIFIAEKYWEGCGGLEMTDQIQVTIAGQACLMLLGVEQGYYFDCLATILVYPGAYLQDSGWNETGFLVDVDIPTLGESWHRGPIVLSWEHAFKGGRDRNDGFNVVIHEFAHRLDGLESGLDGMPPLKDVEQRRRWSEVVQKEYEALVTSAERGQVTLLDQYGATNKAEFFAVASECFFERPIPMRRRHAELYELLQRFYSLDTAAWFENP